MTLDETSAVIAPTTGADARALMDEAAADILIVTPPGTTLTKNGAARLTATFAGSGGPDAVYADLARERKSPGGGRLPAWSLERLRGEDYIRGAVAFRSDAVARLGGVDADLGPAWRLDLLLRGAEAGWRVDHLRQPASAADGPTPPATRESARVVGDHLRRSGIVAEVEIEDGIRRLHRRPPADEVEIVIPTRGSQGTVDGRDTTFVVGFAEDLAGLLADRPNVGVTIVADTGPGVSATYLPQLRDILGNRLTVVPYAEEFNFSRKVNAGIASTSAPYVAVLNDDMRTIDAGWLDQMVAIAAESRVGAVGALLRYEDGTIQHAGHVYDNGTARHAYRGANDSDGLGNELRVDREVSGVTGAALVQRRAVWEEVGGWSEVYPGAYNDVDLCLKVREAGYSIVQVNSAQLFHYESRTRDPRGLPDDRIRLWGRWFHRLQAEGYTIGDQPA